MPQLPLFALSWLGGITLVQFLPELPGPGFLWSLVPVFYLAWRFPGSRFVLVFLLGMCWVTAYAGYQLSQRLEPGLESKDIEVQGFIESIPVQKNRGPGFDFRVLRATHKNKVVSIPARIRLRSYHGDWQVHAGEGWKLTVRVKAPHSYQNPGGFDYEAYLFRNGIGATGYVRTRPKPQRLSKAKWWSLNHLREQVYVRVIKQCASSEYCGLIGALLIGHRSDITQSQWRTLRATGTIHLMAISGLHIGLMAALVYGLVRRVWSLSPVLANRFAAPRIAAGTAILGALIYAALAGFTVPTIRALVMVSIVLIGVIRQEPAWLSRYLSVALIVVLLVQPLAVLDPGFWLSFMAVFFIAYSLAANKAAGWVKQLIYVQLGIFVGLLPVLLFWFGQTSLSAPLANFIVVPVFSLLLIPLVLTGGLWSLVTTGANNIFFQIADQLFSSLWYVLQLLDSSYFQWSPLNSHPGLLLLAISGSLLWLAPRGWPGRWLGGFLWLPLLVSPSDRPATGEYWLHMLDVGQGLAVVIQTKEHVLLFDTGPGYASGFNTGDTVIVPFLRYVGAPVPDMMIISHGDNDHIGGARALTAKFDISELVTNLPDHLAGSRTCGGHPDWLWDGVQFSFLHPRGPILKDHNDSGCVLQVKSQYGSSLLTADIGRKTEGQLVGKFGSRLQSDVLLIPHHGSNTSSSSHFLDNVEPRIGLLSAGYRNRYGHPDKDVIQRYSDRGIPVYSTVRLGAVTVRFVKKGHVIAKHRHRVRRYWHHRLSP